MTTTLTHLRDRWKAARERRAFRWASELVVVVLVLTVIGAWQTRGHLSGVAAPSFALPARDGGVVSLDSLVGKPTMLVFWAPWCAVCKAQSGNVGWVRRLAGERAHVVSVAAAYGRPDDVLDAAREQDMDYPVLLGDDHLAELYRVGAFPTVYFLDSGGRVKRSAVGYTTTLGMLWRLLL